MNEWFGGQQTTFMSDNTCIVTHDSNQFFEIYGFYEFVSKYEINS